MADIKLGRLPDRTPVKITILVSPELNRALGEYADFYRESYGEPAPPPELIPAMLEAFLGSDRAFTRTRKSSGDARA